MQTFKIARQTWTEKSGASYCPSCAISENLSKPRDVMRCHGKSWTLDTNYNCFFFMKDGIALICSNDFVTRFLCRIGPQFNTSEGKSQLLFRIKLLKLGWFYINTKNLCSLLGWFTISAIHEQWKFCLLTGLKLFSCAIAPSIFKLTATVVFAHRF